MPTQKTSTIFKLLSSHITTNPVEFIDRLMNHAELFYHKHIHQKPTYDDVITLESAMSQLSNHLDKKLEAYLNEDPIKNITKRVMDKFNNPDENFVSGYFDGDLDLARISYVLCRVTQPQIVVETGVANGVTSAFILEALRANGKGSLHSVDLPPLAVYGGKEVGLMVPADLRDSWDLNYGTSRRVLPVLLRRLGSIDMFIHDSLHSYHNVKRELKLITPYLSESGVVVVDNIAGNSAYQEWVAKNSPNYTNIIKEGKSILGYSLR